MENSFYWTWTVGRLNPGSCALYLRCFLSWDWQKCHWVQNSFQSCASEDPAENPLHEEGLKPIDLQISFDMALSWKGLCKGSGFQHKKLNPVICAWDVWVFGLWRIWHHTYLVAKKNTQIARVMSVSTVLLMMMRTYGKRQRRLRV